MTLVVRLSGNNFVSEKTQAAFEKALQDEHQVKSTTNEPMPPRQDPESVRFGKIKSPSSSDGTAVPPIPQPETLPMAQPVLDYQSVLTGLERGLAQSYDHQSASLRVHEHYLNNQAEYAKIFFQLVQQQSDLFSNGNATQQQAESTLVVLESLTHSMMRFHDYQAETLSVHEQHLNNQAEYSKAFVQLLQQQYATLTNGNGSHHLVETLPVAPAIAQDPPVVLPIARPQTISPACTPAIPVTIPAPPPASPPDKISGLDTEALAQTLLEVVSEKTGYPAEMLELDMDMEADLGIDSIKRVEILGTMQAAYPDLPQVNPEELAELRTLGQIVDRMGAAIKRDDKVVDGTTDPQPSGLVDVETLSQTLLEVVSEKTGYPAEMLELDMDMEADLGIDSIKRVEILGTMQAAYPDLPQVNPEDLAELRTLGQIVDRMGTAIERKDKAADGAQDPQPSGSVDVETLSQTLLEVVSEKTGYPAEMLELDMDMEADLGIDSIKRVEILGTMQTAYPDLPQVNPEELAELRTLGQIIDRMGNEIPATIKKKEPAKEIGTEPTLNHNIQRSQVRLKSLPAPDTLEFSLPANHICLITDDGSPTSVKLAQALSSQGWKVVVLGFPASVVAARVPWPKEIHHVLLQDMSEEHLQQQLAAISSYGPVGVFIHLNSYNGEGGFPESEKAVVKHVFFLAKHLKPSLTAASRNGRSCFLTVTRLDGEFGLGQTADYGAIGGGLFGLTKTLHLEWETVFCRAVDLHPDLDAELATQHILAELYDPNRLVVEAGYSLQGRTTLVSE